MKNILFSFALFMLSLAARAQSALTVGDAFPDWSFVSLDGQALTLESSRDYVLVLEFWASWCGPCRTSLAALAELKATFGDRLVVVTLSDEDPDRQVRFAERTGYPFHFVQWQERWQEAFPHRIIPHAVVVNPAGRIAAITRPELVTADVIETLLSGEAVELPLKAEADWDPTVPIFARDSQTIAAFAVQPARADAPSYTREYHQGPFAGRRITLVNLPVSGLYRHALATSIHRMELPEDEGRSYCVDFVVAPEQSGQLNSLLLDSLRRQFDWRLDTVRLERTMWVLSAAETGLLLPEAASPGAPTANGTSYRSAGARLADFAAYLEEFGVAGMPVLDETGAGDRLFQLDFSFEPEDQSTFFRALEKMGVAVRKDTRTIVMYSLSPE
ncbi:MAG: redoxin domain-containing protein [Lewinella sp.]|nr:redoxin domain-containing protein [Lewinella sp.]